MIISKKRFEAEVAKRVEEAVCKCHENFYREQRTDERLTGGCGCWRAE